ncbi:MAG: Shedu immune nuclease family protein [Aulosira sp. ZfuVER01]|nr:Shedu immune nuclease family protein [Aulosira sp. ZfuVER01]MDZ8000014.1 Shedu immune nuclease family protein [Aulosira sp. DedVER01a]MDZ8051453.1 Shedu immune nuclease family protein [Aulosira sp. ZfuCHP01]
MKGLDSFVIDLKQCLFELEEFKNLLLNSSELKENQDILPFFIQRLHLSAFIGSYVPQLVRFNQIKHEFTFYGDFRADLAVGDSVNNTYCFIEFEDATQDSIFIEKGRSTSDWSPRFEHGFSQIIDWFWKIDDFKNTSLARSIFGSENIEFYGILVIGRDYFISPIDQARLKWRLNKVLVDSRKVICITFDQLARDIRDRLSLYPLIYEAESQAEQFISTDESDRS